MVRNLFIFISIIFLFSACSENEKDDLRSRSKKQEALQVDVFVAEDGNWDNKIQSSGTLLPYKEVTLKAEVSGKVINTNFKEGEQVRKGQLLVKIDDAVLKAQKNQLEVSQKWLKKQADRNKKLYESEAISEEEYELSLSELEKTEANLKALNAQINLTNIRAPFNGKIGLSDVEVGTFLNVDDVIGNLTVSHLLKLEFSIPEFYANQVEIDQKVIFNIMGKLDTLSADIYAKESRIDKASRMLTVRAIFDNKDHEIPAGTYADVLFETKSNNSGIMIPSESIEPQLSGEIIYLVKNGKVKKQDIVSGKRNEKMVQILKGVQPGDTLLVTGLLAAREGTEVSIQKTVNK